MKKEEDHSSDDFGALFGPSADLAALALAVYAIVVTARNSSILDDGMKSLFGKAEDFLTIATLLLIFSSWFMLVKRADDKNMRILELFFNFKSYYTPLFWGITLIFCSFLFLTYLGNP